MISEEDLTRLLNLEAVDDFTFIGQNQSVGSPNVFGGQVLAQAINAAYRTIDRNRILHSMHAYFLEIGNLEISIGFKVDVLRDGGSFSTRRVTALQNNKTIFIVLLPCIRNNDCQTMLYRLKRACLHLAERTYFTLIAFLVVM